MLNIFRFEISECLTHTHCLISLRSERGLCVLIWMLSCNLLHYYTFYGQTKELPTYKDNDFINDGQKIYIDEESKKTFLEKLKNDVEVCILQVT